MQLNTNHTFALFHIFTSMNALIILLFLTSTPSYEIDSLSIGVNSFVRFQMGKNFFIYRYSRPVLMEQRFSPFVSFQKGNITVKSSLEIAHLWTHYISRPLQPYEYPRLSLVYAGENWIGWKPLRNLQVKAGRQAVTYGTGRIFGIEDWNLIVTYPDMIRIKYFFSKWLVELGGGWFFPQEFELVAPLLQRGFHVLHIQRDSFFIIGLSEYRMGRDSFIVWRHTAGGQLPVKLLSKKAIINLFLEGYFQFGETDRTVPVKGTIRIPIRSFMFVLRTVGQVKSLYGQMSAVVISGQPIGTFNDFEGSFYADLGLWHKYYGLMDWYKSPSDWGYTGLVQLEATLGVKIKNWRVQAIASMFRTLYPPAGYQPYLSSEGTLRVSYVNTIVIFELSGTYGTLSQYLRDLRGLPKIAPVLKNGYVIWTTVKLNISKAIK